MDYQRVIDSLFIDIKILSFGFIEDDGSTISIPETKEDCMKLLGIVNGIR